MSEMLNYVYLSTWRNFFVLIYIVKMNWLCVSWTLSNFLRWLCPFCLASLKGSKKRLFQITSMPKLWVLCARGEVEEVRAALERGEDVNNILKCLEMFGIILHYRPPCRGGRMWTPGMELKGPTRPRWCVLLDSPETTPSTKSTSRSWDFCLSSRR